MPHKPYWEENMVGVETAGVYPISENLRSHINNPDLWGEVQTWGENEEYKSMYNTDLNAPILSSINEAAVFYGVPFPENPMLNEYVPFVNLPDEYLVSSHISYYEDEETETADIFLSTMNKLGTGELFTHYRFVCGTNMNANTGSSMRYFKSGEIKYGYFQNQSNTNIQIDVPAESYVKIDEESSNIENYISPVNDIEALLYTVDYGYDSYSNLSCHAIFALNGITYFMTIYPYDIGVSYNAHYDTLKAIIDAYIFE